MIKDEPTHLLFIEPQNPPSAEPLLDAFTWKILNAWRGRTENDDASRGFHICSCGAISDNRTHTLKGGLVVNLLCVHYMAYHRDEVPASEMDKLKTIPEDAGDATEFELRPPPPKKTREIRQGGRGLDYPVTRTR